MSQVVDQDDRCEVSLPDGSVVDVNTEEGANAFLMGGASSYFSSTVNKIKELEKKRRLNPRQEMQLYKHYDSIDCIALNADRELFRAKVPQSEIEFCLKYFVEKIEERTYDGYVVQSCINMFFHQVPVELAITIDFFSSLADFFKPHSGGERILPKNNVYVHTLHIVCVAMLTLIENGWSIIEVFDKLEPSGIVLQLLRWSTKIDPEEDSVEWEGLGELFQNIRSRPDFLSEKFKVGEPCGDMLVAILAEEQSSGIKPQILNLFRGIHELAEVMDMTKFKRRAKKYGIFCSNCYKIGNAEKRLYKCSKCGIEDYCSEDCQRQHWKQHKRECDKLTDLEKEIALSTRMATLRFMNQHFETVFRRIDDFCSRTGLEAKDAVVDVNFMPNEDGIIPAFADEPVFNIEPVQKYISGEVAPEWWKSREQCKDFAEDVLVAEAKESVSGILLVNHADEAWSYPNILELYRQHGTPILRKLVGP